MTELTTLGADLRRERERRGLALRSIAENTKLSIAVLEGLEGDDISRWPGGIFRRAFVRSYAKSVGLDVDDVIRRFEKQYPPEGAEAVESAQSAAAGRPVVVRQFPSRFMPTASMLSSRARLIGTAADLTVAMVLAFACAAAGSRLLWPVLLIACYYAAGVLRTGTSPMVALLSEGLVASSKPKAPAAQVPLPAPVPAPAPVVVAVAVEVPAPAPAPAEAALAPLRQVGRHAARTAGERPVRQRRGMQAPV
jgi:transcriptional regulator with XRE-family HTH domain